MLFTLAALWGASFLFNKVVGASNACRRTRVTACDWANRYGSCYPRPYCWYRSGGATPNACTVVLGNCLGLDVGVRGTSLAYLIYYWLIERVGPSRTLIVTYLLPCIALVYGALLHESIGLNAVGGLALVLTGIFVTGRKTEQKTMATPSATKTIKRR